MADKLELGQSVDGQEANASSSIDRYMMKFGISTKNTHISVHYSS